MGCLHVKCLRPHLAFSLRQIAYELKEICDVWVRHCSLVAALDPALFIPKHYLMVRCNDRIGVQGNLWRYITFWDESINKELKRVLRLCHQSTLETTAMVKLGKHLDSVSKRMRRHL